MPVYNTKEQFLREAIQSILSQTYTDFEFLILNDSPENVEIKHIVESYKDKRIKYIENECHLGIAKSRNKLIDLAKGEYLAVFDHDDISLPTRLEKQIQYLDSNLDVALCGTKVKYIVSDKESTEPTSDRKIKIGLMGGNMLAHSSVMIRKSVLDEHNIRYEDRFSPAEDYALFCRLIPYTKFHNLNDEVLLYYRDHKENTSHLQKEKMRQATASIWALVRRKHPFLYEDFLFESIRTKYYRLFGFLPILTICQGVNYKNVYLFDKILVLKIKTNMKIQED